jgi:hypothetical protein
VHPLHILPHMFGWLMVNQLNDMPINSLISLSPCCYNFVLTSISFMILILFLITSKFVIFD